MLNEVFAVIVIAVLLGVIFSFWKYKKLESIVKSTRVDLDKCEFNISIINEQLNTFRDTIRKIDSQITDLEEKASKAPKARKSKKVESDSNDSK